MKFVKVMQIPGRTVTVEVPDSATLQECVDQAGMDLGGFQVTSSASTSANGSTVVEDGGSVVLTRQVKGA